MDIGYGGQFGNPCVANAYVKEEELSKELSFACTTEDFVASDDKNIIHKLTEDFIAFLRNFLWIKIGTSEEKTLPEAQRTQGIESIT